MMNMIMKNIELGTKLADEIGFTPDRFGKFTILHLSGRQIELSKEFRDPKTPQAIEEMSQKILQKGYDFRY
jgi:hypothetical protein